jgi:predicted nucleotidyltransferase
MRTGSPRILPLFRSEMQVRLLALLLLQPERSWTLQELVGVLDAPQSSVHRELTRATEAGIVTRDPSVRPHRFAAAADDPLYEPLATLLRRSVGVEAQLRAVLDRPDVDVASIFGSWASGIRGPASDIDVLVVGDVNVRELRRDVRPIGRMAGRSIDLTVFSLAEFRKLVAERSSFARTILDAPTTPLVGDLGSLTGR